MARMFFSDEMRFRNTLIPILTVFLVVQGVVAGAPHQHGSECPVDQVVASASMVDEPHHCLACSVHVPAVAGAMPYGLAVWVSKTDAETGGIASICTLFLLASSGPRGPPSVSDQG